MLSRALTRSLSRAVHTQAHAVAVSGSYAYVTASRGDGLTVVLLDLHSPPPPSPPPPPPPPSPPPPPPPITCGPGTFLSSISNQCEIACDPASNGRRMATEVPLDTALCQVALDDVQILGDRVRDVSSYLEEHPEDFASIRSEELRSRLKQLFGQPALA